MWDHAQISQKVTLSPTKVIPLTATTTPKTWVMFTYYNPMIQKLTNLFRYTNLKITFRTNNTIHNILYNRPHNTNILGNAKPLL